MKAGIICNPNAGKSVIEQDLLKILNKKLKDDNVYCTSVSYEYLKHAFPNLEKIEIGKPLNTYVDSVNSGRALANMDYVISLGGDGTVSDIIFGQKKAGKLTPIFGIGCGTANAGLFIQCGNSEELETFDFSAIGKEEVLGLDVYEGDDYIGTAFNDVVLSDTIVSTVNGNTCTVNAQKFLNGQRVPQYPSPIGTSDTIIKINNTVINNPCDISQIIIAPVHNKNVYFAKAVNGKLCWLPFYNKDGAMTISSNPIICMPPEDCLKAETGMVLSQYLIGENDSIQIYGTKGYAIVDGNPRIKMEETNRFAKILLNKSAACKLKVNKIKRTINNKEIL